MSTQAKAPEVFDPFLSGNYAPVSDETAAECVEVIGEIPADLNGHFLRIGPNPVYVPDPATYHIFDGDGMIHSVQFDNGQATYRNRFVDTEGLRKERAKGTWIWKGMASMGDFVKGVAPPAEGLMKNTANTAMVYHNKTLYALMEAAPPHRMSLPGLETEGEHTFGGKLRHPFTAHPKVDAVTGEMVTFGYSPIPPFLTHSVVSPEGEIVHTAPITIPKGVMMHDCAITEHYTVFLDMPNHLRFRPRHGRRADAGLGAGERLASRRRAAHGHGQEREVVRRRYLHGFPRLQCLGGGRRGDRPGQPLAAHRRIPRHRERRQSRGHDGPAWPALNRRLNMKTGAAAERYLDTKHHCDFTRINDDLCGRKTRYIYAAQFDLEHDALFNAALKYDDQTGEVQVHALGNGRWGGEGVFCKRDGAVAEDDGYVVLFVWDEIRQRSECVVMDARDFTAPPVARIMIPARVPFGFHAGWAPAG